MSEKLLTVDAKQTNINVGDWIKSYSPGIWRVYRIIDEFYELRYRLDKERRSARGTLVLSKRFVDGNWRKAFAAEACDMVPSRLLSDDERERLMAFRASNPELVAEFEAYKPSSDFMTCIRLNYSNNMKFEELQARVSEAFGRIELTGLTNDEVLQTLQTSGLARLVSEGFGNATVRFLCRDHELRDRQFVFRAADVVPF